MLRVVSRDGTAIAFDRVGRGPTIIVVDGAFSHRAMNPTAARLAELLAPEFTVYTYDRRGRGESGDRGPYAVEREIEDIEALIADGGGCAYVLGGSSGAVLALDAAGHGLPISKLAVYEPPFIVDDSRPPLPCDYIARLNELLLADCRGDAVEYFFTQALRMPTEAVAAMRGQAFWQELEAVASTLAYDATIIGDTMSGNPLPTSRWEGVTMPTLVMDGGAGEAHMHTGADALAAILANAERCTLPGQTHDVAPDVLAPVLAEFFSGALTLLADDVA